MDPREATMSTRCICDLSKLRFLQSCVDYCLTYWVTSDGTVAVGIMGLDMYSPFKNSRWPWLGHTFRSSTTNQPRPAAPAFFKIIKINPRLYSKKKYNHLLQNSLKVSKTIRPHQSKTNTWVNNYWSLPPAPACFGKQIVLYKYFWCIGTFMNSGTVK